LFAPGKPIDPPAFATALAEVARRMNLVNINIHETKASFPANVKYRDMAFDTFATSEAARFSAMFYVAIAGALAEADLVPELLCEKAFLVPGHATRMLAIDVTKIAASYIDQIKKGRIFANRSVEISGLESGSAQLNHLRKRYADLYSLDPSFQVILSLFDAHVGEKGVERMKDNILALMPSSTVHPTPEAVKLAITHLSQGRMRTFCGVGVGTVVDDVFKWVQSIADQHPPEFQGEFSSEFVKKIRERLGFFYTFQKAASSTGVSPPTLYAKDAANFDFAKMQKIIDAKTEFMPSELSKLTIFSWLLTPAQRSSLKTWADGVCEKLMPKKRNHKPDVSNAARVAKLFKNG
jgi:hypothetical protein